MKFNTISFLEDYNIEYWTEGKNCKVGWINIQCPLCGDDKNHGGINIESGQYNCWKCGKQDIVKVFSIYFGYDYEKVKSILYSYTYRGEILLRKKGVINKSVLIDKIELPGAELQKMHKRYLEKRGFDSDLIIKRYGIKGTSFVGDWKYRIIIPITYKNKIVSFVGRDITNDQFLRYKYPPVEKSIMNPKHLLYDLDNCKNNILGIVEGIFDKWKMGDDFIASLGTVVTPEQISLMKEYKNIFIIFDPGVQAQKKAKKLGYQLASFGIDVEIIKLDGDKDPAEFTEKEVKGIRKELGFDE